MMGKTHTHVAPRINFLAAVHSDGHLAACFSLWRRGRGCRPLRRLRDRKTIGVCHQRIR